MALRKKQTKKDSAVAAAEVAPAAAAAAAEVAAAAEDDASSSTSSSEAEAEDAGDSDSDSDSDERMDGDANSSDDDEDDGGSDDDDDGNDDDDDDDDDGEESDDEDDMEEDDDEDDAVLAGGDGTVRDNDNGGSGGGGEHCTFDLSNLLAFNTHQINAAELYQKSKMPDKDGWYRAEPTIPPSPTTMPGAVSEALLLSKAAEGATQLLRELWKLPNERTDVGTLARLPRGSDETKLPRSLPPPPPKQKSKWDEFALKRGIAPHEKRSRKVYDESTGEWRHLTGSSSNRANAGPESWPIIEVKKNDDPNRDPWEKLREEKKARVGKNTVGRMRNAERAGSLERGSANRLVKDNARLEKQRDMMREKDRKRGLTAPAGVPTDMAGRGKKGGMGGGGEDVGGGGGAGIVRRGKPSTTLALKATQVSTASLGRFDRLREGEPERKGQLSKNVAGKKRKQPLDAATDGGGGGTNGKFLQSEAKRSADILSRVMNGGPSSKERERDVKRGKYAKGETAYDYEYDDGLGGGSFRKKKGRAGAGKMKKITKKRIK